MIHGLSTFPLSGLRVTHRSEVIGRFRRKLLILWDEDSVTGFPTVGKLHSGIVMERCSRQARVVAVGTPHHITQRGNNCQDVFLLESDRHSYVGLLAEQSRQCGLQILGYCLMTNHVHLVAVPGRSDSLANTLRRVHSRYAQSFNRRYQRSGHLWQNRFFSCGLDRDHLVTALAYVDLNPVRAGMVGSAQVYPWSSARAHVEEKDPLGLIDFSLWHEVRRRGDWAECLRRPTDPESTRRLREATQRVVPLGSEGFVGALEQSTGRCLALRGPGRPSGRKVHRASAG